MSEQIDTSPASVEVIVSPISVISHDHDELNEIYRLVIGRTVSTPARIEEVPVLDEDGNQQYDLIENVDLVTGEPITVPEPKVDDRGQLVYNEDGSPAFDQVVQKQPKLKTTIEQVPEQVVGYVETCDYIFDHDDPRWFDANGTRRPDSDVAAEQKQAVRDALFAATSTPAAATGAGSADGPAQQPRAMPGVGEAL